MASSIFSPSAIYVSIFSFDSSNKLKVFFSIAPKSEFVVSKETHLSKPMEIKFSLSRPAAIN
jgi:hypothetical protein